jgi:hypothetical protein
MEKEYHTSIFKIVYFWSWLLSIGPFLYLTISSADGRYVVLGVWVLWNIYFLMATYKSLYFVVVKHDVICIRHDLNAGYEECISSKDISSIEVKYNYNEGHLIVIITKLHGKRWWNINGLSGEDLWSLKNYVEKINEGSVTARREA